MKNKKFDWSKGPEAALIREIVEQATFSGLKDNRFNFALILKEHWWGFERDAAMRYNWDREIIEDFAADFGLKAIFERDGLFVVLRGGALAAIHE